MKTKIQELYDRPKHKPPLVQLLEKVFNFIDEEYRSSSRGAKFHLMISDLIRKHKFQNLFNAASFCGHGLYKVYCKHYFIERISRNPNQLRYAMKNLGYFSKKFLMSLCDCDKILKYFIFDYV